MVDAVDGPEEYLRGEFSRVTFRVTSHRQNPKTEANGRKATKESEDAKSLELREFHQESLYSLGFREEGCKAPTLSATSKH
jgi:hypothetical protein